MAEGLKFDRLFWLDLEMTGLDAQDDLILEVAVIITDWDLNELDTYCGIVKQDSRKLKMRLKKNRAFWDANPIARDGLVKQNLLGKTSEKIERELLGLVKKHFKGSVLLAGNSIHIDRRFIVNNWSKLEKKLYYRMLDVTAWKVVFEQKYNKKFLKPEAHRALDDIRGSIAELKYYQSKIKV